MMVSFSIGGQKTIPSLRDNETGWAEGYVGFEAEQRARDIILTRVREAVREDFLILVNTNRRKIPRTGWAINGTFMETLRDHDAGYTHDGLAEIENTLLWSEANLREPRINCLEGWGIKDEPPDSPANRRWMRVFTTMSLTYSDGYVLYNDGRQHEHYWYNFWDADLGQPIGEKARLMKTEKDYLSASSQTVGQFITEVEKCKKLVYRNKQQVWKVDCEIPSILFPI